MPGINAIIGANADPMAREFKRVEQMSQVTGQRIQENISGAGSHRSGGSSIMRETLVVMREISRGNWTRVPGSLSLLMNQIGLFRAAGTILAGTFGIVAAAVTGIALGLGIAYMRAKGMAEALTGLKFGDFQPTYIAKALQGINSALQGQKELNIEIKKSIDLYESAAERAKRVSEVTKERYEHLRKMNSFEKDPVKKAERELEINRQERNEELTNANVEKFNLEREAEGKKAQADAIKVASKEADAENIARTKANLDAADKQMKDHQMFGGPKDKMAAIWHGGIMPGQAQAAFDMAAAADKQRIQGRADAEKAHQDAVNNAQHNEELRKQREDLIHQSGGAAAKAATLGLSLPEMQRRIAEKNQHDAEEAAAGIAAGRKFSHGSVNSLQQIGAYASPGVLVDTSKKQLHELKGINNKLDRIGGFHNAGFGRVKH